MMRVAAILVCVLAVNSVAAPAHAFDLIRFFQQPTQGRGVSVAVNGIDRWTVRTRGWRRGSVGRMKERFAYDDGTRRLQDWTLRPATFASGRRGYTATRPDLKGPAIFRPAGANAYNYVWHQYLEPKARSGLVTLRGRLTLRLDGSLLNQATVFKSVLPIGRVRVVFRPQPR